jgi:RNA polymerase sigma-70 factor (ECF subfamily)
VSPESTHLAPADRSLDDMVLVHAAKAGDIGAFEALVNRYDARALRMAQHLVHNLHDAEDVVQEAFLKAFQHLDQFREDAKFSTWLIRIVVNQGLMMLRKRRATREVPAEDKLGPEDEHLPLDIADWAPNPEQLYRAVELRRILRKTLQALSPALKTVFVLRDIEGLSLEETADALELTVTAVKAWSLRARLQLRERLSAYFHDEKQGEPDSASLDSAVLPRS